MGLWQLYQSLVFSALHLEFLGLCFKLILIGVSCGKPPVPNGATILGASYLYQDQVVYSCPPGKLGHMLWFSARSLWYQLSATVQTDKCNIL